MKTPTHQKPPVPEPSPVPVTYHAADTSGAVRNCTTCAHRFPGRYDPLEILAHTCLVTGNSICLSRRENVTACNKSFSAWQPQPVQVAGPTSINVVNCESDLKRWFEGMGLKA